MAHPTDVLQLSQLFTATLEPLPLRHFDLEHRPSALSLGEWRSGQTGWSTVQLVEPCSSADAKTHGRIFVLLKDLELVRSSYLLHSATPG